MYEIARHTKYRLQSRFVNIDSKYLNRNNHIVYTITMNVYFFRMDSLIILSIFYQNKNYIGLNRILTSTFGQFMGKYFIIVCVRTSLNGHN